MTTKELISDQWTGAQDDEFKGLYFADVQAEYLTLKSLKTMVRMNHAWWVIPFHNFYSDVEV